MGCQEYLKVCAAWKLTISGNFMISRACVLSATGQPGTRALRPCESDTAKGSFEMTNNMAVVQVVHFKFHQ